MLQAAGDLGFKKKSLTADGVVCVLVEIRLSTTSRFSSASSAAKTAPSPPCA